MNTQRASTNKAPKLKKGKEGGERATHQKTERERDKTERDRERGELKKLKERERERPFHQDERRGEEREERPAENLKAAQLHTTTRGGHPQRATRKEVARQRSTKKRG